MQDWNLALNPFSPEIDPFFFNLLWADPICERNLIVPEKMAEHSTEKAFILVSADKS
jgi:hypothetical protein